MDTLRYSMLMLACAFVASVSTLALSRVLSDPLPSWYSNDVLKQQVVTRNGTVMAIDATARTILMRSSSVVVSNSENQYVIHVPQDTFIATQSIELDSPGRIVGFSPLNEISFPDITPGSFVSVLYQKDKSGRIVARSIIVQNLAAADTAP